MWARCPAGGSAKSFSPYPLPIPSPRNVLDKKGVDSGFTIDGIVADLSCQMQLSSEAIRHFELQNLHATFSMKNSWELSTIKYDLTEFTFDLENIGKLNVQLSFSGLTAFYNTAEGLYSSITGTAVDQNTKNAKYLLRLAFVQQLTLNSAQIRFDDASFTDRTFDYISKMGSCDARAIGKHLCGERFWRGYLSSGFPASGKLSQRPSSNISTIPKA